MAKHTPGPWTFNGGDDAPILHIYAPDDKHLFHGDRSLAEQEANARLIAAAPEMLEALQAVADRCNGGIDSTDQETGETFRALISAAIAKAGG